MNWFCVGPLMATGVLAQAGPQTAQQAPPWATLVPMVLILGAFFIVSSRMQKKKQREHAEMLNSVHRGDSVVTSGGIVGEIDRKSTRLNSSHQIISYAVFCLKKKTQ